MGSGPGSQEFKTIQESAQREREASRSTVARGKPAIYVSTSGGITDVAAYAPNGTILLPDDLPVIIVQINWDDVESEDFRPIEEDSETGQAGAWLDDERLSKRLRTDIKVSFERARRWADQ